jgi:non-canonical (house-cleaning) NTP pyrophosphatase
MKKIIVASNNPVKIRATLAGFQTMFPSEVFEIAGIRVRSNALRAPSSVSKPR